MCRYDITPLEFGKQLKEKILKKEMLENIGNWVFDVFYSKTWTHDSDFREKLLHLGEILIDKKSTISYEEITKLANDLMDDYRSDGYISPRKFGIQLKEKILQKEGQERIGGWAFHVHSANLRSSSEMDNEFSQLLLDIGTMETSEEMEMSYKKLNQIADNLIAGKKVVL
jgi:hypothetical protein